MNKINVEKVIDYTKILKDNETLQEELDKTRLSELDKEYRIDKAIEYIEQQKLHKFQDTTGGLNYEERKLLEILKGE